VTRLAHPGNYSPVVRPVTRGIVWHATAGPGTNEGQYPGTVAWFQRAGVGASAHVVFSWDGSEGTVCVPLDQTAWHASASGGHYNREWLSVELPRRAPLTDGPAWPDSLWAACGYWARQMGERFGFDAGDPQCHRTHQEIQPADRTDPGPWFRLDVILREARR
jgi:N-acetyl-anhydromuramyl-L-alanine amidase AmpD